MFGYHPMTKIKCSAIKNETKYYIINILFYGEIK